MNIKVNKRKKKYIYKTRVIECYILNVKAFYILLSKELYGLYNKIIYNFIKYVFNNRERENTSNEKHMNTFHLLNVLQFCQLADSIVTTYPIQFKIMSCYWGMLSQKEAIYFDGNVQ